MPSYPIRYYAVRRGRRTGIFTSWDEAKAQVNRFGGCEHQSFEVLDDAVAFMQERDPLYAPPPWLFDRPISALLPVELDGRAVWLSLDAVALKRLANALTRLNRRDTTKT